MAVGFRCICQLGCGRPIQASIVFLTLLGDEASRGGREACKNCGTTDPFVRRRCSDRKQTA